MTPTRTPLPPGRYVRKRQGLTAHHERPFTSTNCCIVEVNRVLLANICLQPNNSLAVPESLENWTPGQHTILVVAEDFNSLHWSWQAGHNGHASLVSRLADWMEAAGLWVRHLEAPAYRAGNTLNLIFTDIPRSERLRARLCAALQILQTKIQWHTLRGFLLNAPFGAPCTPFLPFK